MLLFVMRLKLSWVDRSTAIGREVLEGFYECFVDPSAIFQYKGVSRSSLRTPCLLSMLKIRCS